MKIRKKTKQPKTSKRKLGRPFKGITKKLPRRTKSAEERVSEALSTVPRITNDTVAGHREEVLSSARKYIYPLQHSKHRVVRISISLLVLVIVAFFVGVGLGLYKFQSTSTFIYDVTRVIPFPVAKAGNHWISYESYLFELRRNMHYYQTQQQADFATKDGKAQLSRLKHQAMAQVVQDAYVKQLAARNDVSVSNKAVDDELALVRSQNRLGSNDHVFKEVLQEFWGWNESDFKRELKQQLLQQAVVAKLDKPTVAKADQAMAQLRTGTDFAALAGQVSEDPGTKATGGQYPEAITIGARELPPLLTAELFRMKAGQISDVINTGYTLDIVKVIDMSGSSLHAAHIQFNLADISTFVQPLQQKEPAHQYIKL